ncbi:hypothetical protein Btru_075895 [Bulinus truncatus]|nr:hypothetical protein Btru_075895 [Bulinus truncatus]
MKYGDTKLGILKVADFQGNLTGASVLRFTSQRKIHPTWDAVPSEDVRLEILKRKLTKSNGLEQLKYKTELELLLKQRKDTEEFFRNVVGQVSQVELYDHYLKAPVQFTGFKCYRESVTLIQKLCPGMNLVQNDYALRRLRVLANLCENEVDQRIWWAVAKTAHKTSYCTN